MENEVVDKDTITPAAEPGFSIGSYRIDAEPISTSTHSLVFVTRDAKGRRVVLKTAYDPLALKSEAAALKAVSSIPVAAVPKYVDFVEYGSQAALVEEYVSGKPLATPRRGVNFNRLRPYEVRRFLDHMLQTLREAHCIGYVHNAVEPSNILCRAEDPLQPYVLLDFSRAEKRGAAGRYREVGPVDANVATGKPAYSAPEIASGASGFFCSDIYSVGIIAMQLLTGAELNDLSWNAQGHITLPLYPFTKDPVLERVLVTMTCHAPGQRYQEVDEVLAGLAKRETGEILDKPVEKPQTGRIIVAVVLFVIFVLLASVAWKSAVAEYCRQSVDCRSTSTR